MHLWTSLNTNSILNFSQALFFSYRTKYFFSFKCEIYLSNPMWIQSFKSTSSFIKQLLVSMWLILVSTNPGKKATEAGSEAGKSQSSLVCWMTIEATKSREIYLVVILILSIYRYFDISICLSFYIFNYLYVVYSKNSLGYLILKY